MVGSGRLRSDTFGLESWLPSPRMLHKVSTASTNANEGKPSCGGRPGPLSPSGSPPPVSVFGENVCMDSVNGRMSSVKRGCLSPTPRHQCQTAGLPGPDCAYRGEQPGPVGRPLGWSAGRAPAAMNCFRVEPFPSRDDCVCGSGQIDIVSQGLGSYRCRHARNQPALPRVSRGERTPSEKPGRWLARPDSVTDTEQPNQ